MRRQGIITIIIIGILLVTIPIVTIILNHQSMINNTTVNMTKIQNNTTINNINNTTLQEHENKTDTPTSTNTTSQNRKNRNIHSSNQELIPSPEDFDSRVGPNCPPPVNYTRSDYDIKSNIGD